MTTCSSLLPVPSLESPRLTYPQRAIVLALAALALALAGCASVPPPTAAMAVSDAAVLQARDAGATELAPEQMRSAREKLDQAKLAMASEDYDRARRLAHEAEADARLAEARAQSGKARKNADEVQESIRVLREEVSRKGR